MALGFVVATDLVNAALNYYVRGKTMSQTTYDKPLMRELRSAQKAFPSGKGEISEPIQGTYMSDTPGFFAGYSGDDQLAFAQASNIQRVVYPWRETHAGLGITWSELKSDGITITESNKTSDHSDAEATRLTGVLENRLDDFGESWQRAFNMMLWLDGSQDAKSVPGLQSILTETPTVGTTGGLNRATYPFWRNRLKTNIVPSGADQTLTTTLRSEMRQLRRFGGKPDKLLAGSLFMDALELEVQAKGVYTQTGFADKKSVDIGMPKISLNGIGTFEYDPTMDDLGKSAYSYIYDSRRIQLRPMQGEDNKVVQPERPYNYMVFFRSVTWTGALVCRQLNCNGIYSVKV